MTLMVEIPMPAKDLEKILTELGKVSSVEVNPSIDEINEFIKKYFQKHFGIMLPGSGKIKQSLCNLNKKEVLMLYEHKGIHFENISWCKGDYINGYTITLDPSSFDLSRVKGSAIIRYQNPKLKQKIEQLKKKLENYKLEVVINSSRGYLLMMN